MSIRSSTPVTQLLTAASGGDSSANELLWSIFYQELRGVAQRQMVKHGSGHTLQPTALVHEAWFRLVSNADVEWANRRHFFAAAANAMRQILVDDARKRNRQKRGGGLAIENNPEAAVVFDQDPVQVLAIHEALSELETRDPRQAEIVMLRFFAGLTVDETASALGLSPRTVELDWRVARAWLYRELSKGDTVERDREDVG